MITREQAKRSVGKGWHELIDMFYDEFPDCDMIQVKEKYGSLCLYHNNSTDSSTHLELQIRDESSSMCEECGKPTESREIRGWVWTLCDEHYNQKLNDKK